jgi:hypothetical protein
VRRNGSVALGGDGQVTVGETVMKAKANKVRALGDGKLLAGFAGSAADALTLFEKFEEKLQRYPGNFPRAAVELAKDWRSDRVLRRLEALLPSPTRSTDSSSRAPVSSSSPTTESSPSARGRLRPRRGARPRGQHQLGPRRS